MPAISSLLARLPKIKEARMSASGQALWICWQKDLDPMITQTLQNYGGMAIVSEYEQSLWFFFTNDVYLALARLDIWAKFNDLHATIELLPAKIIMGVEREVGLHIDIILTTQEMIPSKTFELWIHNQLATKARNMPGIEFLPKASVQGMMANIPWSTLNADVRLPYSSSRGWYAILCPLGNPLDKQFQTNWTHMLKSVEKILKTQKLKYLMHDYSVMISVDNLRLLRTWVRDLLSATLSIKTEYPELYWPCVSVVIDRKGLNFSQDLKNKVGLNWNKLIPDFPYMIYQNAYLLGEGFNVQDLQFSADSTSMNSWCNVALGDGGKVEHTIPIVMAGQLISGKTASCFYCGMQNHNPQECPTTQMRLSTNEVWNNAASLDINAINNSFRDIESNLAEHGISCFNTMLAGTDPKSTLLHSIFAINEDIQLRSAPRYWLSKNIDTEEQHLVRDKNVVWDYYDALCKRKSDNLKEVEAYIKEGLERNPRESRMHTIIGFLNIDKSDFRSARKCFIEAAALASTPAVQAWNGYLQARMTEIEGDYTDAIERYAEISKVAPKWDMLEYRQLVCKVKMGFTEQTIMHFLHLIQEDCDFFNICLIDPELERGQLLILTHLSPLWVKTEQAANREIEILASNAEAVNSWFSEDNPMAQRMRSEIDGLLKLSQSQNYVAYVIVIERRPTIEKHINTCIEKEVELLQKKFKRYLLALQDTRDQASWFPFPSALREFSREFNEGANIINWAYSSNFTELKAFKRANEITETLDDILKRLKKKLQFLRVVRDTTLFSLTLIRTFFWFEVTGLLLCLIAIPLIIMLGDQMNLGWLQSMLGSQKWEMQKVVIGIVTVMSLGLAALRTTLIFDKKRNKLIADARIQREEIQQIRLDKIVEERKKQSKLLAIEKKRSKEEDMKRRMLG